MAGGGGGGGGRPRNSLEEARSTRERETRKGERSRGERFGSVLITVVVI
jgi:hypothetical protein